MDDFNKACEILVQLSRLIAEGKLDDAKLYLTRTAYLNAKKSDSSVWLLINNIFMEAPQKFTATRSNQNLPLPQDGDTKLQLIKVEPWPIDLDVTPVWSGEVKSVLEQLVLEQSKKELLKHSGLTSSRTVLFSGPPGVGKTLASRWVANQLHLPHLTLNLSSVMSSFLGKTGNNIRRVFEYASCTQCVLLLDEFDAIAKRRDDDAEIGELKRLVTVLLQEIDNWDNDSILIAATNHQNLLDPAVWRRFDVTVFFAYPDVPEIEKATEVFMGEDYAKVTKLSPVLASLMKGCSYSDIRRDIQRIRKMSKLNETPVEDELQNWMESKIAEQKHPLRLDTAMQLMQTGISQRKVNQLTGISRDTIRRKMGGK